MKILLCGSRGWADGQLIRTVLRTYPSYTVIIHGDCAGADKIGGLIAEGLGMEVISYPANWDKLGKKAGPIRNTLMLEVGKPDLVMAFHNNVFASKGTRNMIGQAHAKGVPVHIYSKQVEWKIET